MICVIEMASAIFDDHFYTRNFARWELEGFTMKVKNRFAQRDKNNFDIIILGDCYNISGIKPAIIEKRTGLSCWNFSAYAWQTIFASYILFNN